MAYKIVLDAGHGGTDPGAIYKERKEKDDNLELTRAVGKILEDNGIDVVYTRTTDVYQTPFEKARIANEVGADYFISFHRNSSPKENFETLPDISREMRREVQKMQECRPIVQDVRKYIYANYQDRNLDLRQVSHAIGCNSSYISRIMKQELGISFKDFLTRLRISQAVRLMEDRELSINQIAEKVGYSNQHYFSAAFKNCQGMSPSEFRKNMLQLDRNGL